MFHVGRCPPISLSNGVVGSYDKSPGGGLYPSGTRASITCNTGFYGPPEVQCFALGSWVPHTPSCERGNQKSRNFFISLLKILFMICIII